MSLKRAAIPLVLAGAIGIGGYLIFGKNEKEAVNGSPIVEIHVPESLSAKAQVGKKKYAANCMDCHGENAAGQEGVAPPLVHFLYEPGHHSDESFQRAVALGVKSHHWPFGDMPPVEDLTRRDVEAILAYIRELQQANGI